MKLFVLLLHLVFAIHAGGDHVALLRCAEHANCLERMDDAVIEVIRANMHNTSDPCENFWDYACGEWTAAPYYDHVDNFGAAGNYYAQKLQKYLTDTDAHATTTADASATNAEASTKSADTRNLRAQLRRYYESCVGVKSYYLALPEYLNALVTHTPALQWLPHNTVWRDALKQSEWTHFNWLDAVAELRQYGLNGVFLDESVGFASNDAQKYVIELKMPEDDARFESKQQILRLLAEFGWVAEAQEEQRRDLAHYESLVTRVWTLEQQLQALRTKAKQRAATNELEAEAKDETEGADQELLTLAQLQQRMPLLDWTRYFGNLLNTTSTETQQKLPLQLADVDYMRDLPALLAQTDARTLGAYILLRLCRHLQQLAPQITANNCIEHMGALLPLGLDYVYVRFVYDAATRAADEAALAQLFARLKAQFVRYLHANKLALTRTQRAYLLEKLAGMRLQVGNLPAHMSTADYERYYARVQLRANNFYHNHLALLRFRTQQQHAPLCDGVGRLQPDSFYVYDDVQQPRNAPYFVHQRNLLVVPFVFLQLPFFHHRLSPLLQHSLTGWILAHELNHAFETFGIVLDAAGNESTVGARIREQARFARAVQCLAHAPTAALIERIADVNGFQLAYDAYFGGNVTHTETERNVYLSALELSAQQLYFLNFAQFFCGTLPQAIAHDRDDVRVIETLANMPEFAATFQCRVGQREYPAKQCEMWRP